MSYRSHLDELYGGTPCITRPQLTPFSSSFCHRCYCTSVQPTFPVKEVCLIELLYARAASHQGKAQGFGSHLFGTALRVSGMDTMLN